MFFTKRFFIALATIFVFFLLGYVFPVCFTAAWMLSCILFVLTGIDVVWGIKNRKAQGVTAHRICPGRFSNGDENEVCIAVESHLSVPIHVDIIDELPDIFQRRDVLFPIDLKPRERRDVVYHLRPVRRGVYGFGRIRLFVTLPIGLITFRLTDGQPQDVKVYPSYLMLNRYELMAAHHNLTELGIKRIRRLGHHTEFEHIKEYVRGDDYRTVNWKASARRHQIMVNTYQDERSQQVYSVIDKGRIMQSAFRGMTLLDYAINASLVLSYVAIRRDDKAGLATFSDRFETFLPASRRSGQMQHLLETLYRQATDFGESDYSALSIYLNKHVTKRSLLILYTNFDSLIGIDRQLGSLRTLARRHVVLVVFFENAGLTEFAARRPRTIEGYFNQTIAEKYICEKQHIASHLRRHGIHALLTAPERLSVDVINKYLEMKSRHLI
ncbi:cell division protein FtsB [Tannerella sp. oral taxon 808]|nr:cell division protein FtsB [Tannerella sp. oral taxon 808]